MYFRSKVIEISDNVSKPKLYFIENQILPHFFGSKSFVLDPKYIYRICSIDVYLQIKDRALNVFFYLFLSPIKYLTVS